MNLTECAPQSILYLGAALYVFVRAAVSGVVDNWILIQLESYERCTVRQTLYKGLCTVDNSCLDTAPAVAYVWVLFSFRFM